MNNNTVMTPELVEPLLDDMGFEAPEAREATRKHSLAAIDAGEITWGVLNASASAFAEGYETCLKVHS